MIKNNKVTNSVLLPKVLALTVLVSLISGASVFVTKGKLSNDTHIIGKNIGLFGLIALLVICVAADLHSDFKKNEKFLSLVARKYLKKELEEHPELKQFEKNLDNPQAIQDVSTLIFNSLRPSERKLVTQIILEANQNLRDHRKYGTEDAESSKIYKVFLNDARNKIITVLKEHASVHPEFISDIHAIMAKSDMIYMVQKNSIKQSTR